MITISGKIPIRIHPIFWVLVVLIAWINTYNPFEILIWAVAIVFSLLIHEYGHALTATFFGQNASIDLMGFGGMTQHDGRKLPWWQDFMVVFNGPLAGFTLYLIAAFL